jgi:micrococcal nuclease
VRRFVILVILAAVAFGVSYVSGGNTNTTPNTQEEGLKEAYCTRVVDGDTIVVKIGLEEFKVRYIGIDTPETVDPNRPTGFFGKEASQKNTELVLGRTLKLEKDVSDTDKYGRLLRYAYVDNVMINSELVRLGYAKAATYPPDIKYSALFVKMEQEARQNKRGLWAY